MEAGWQFQNQVGPAGKFERQFSQDSGVGEEEVGPAGKLGRLFCQDSGIGDDIDGGDCQEIADLFGPKITLDVPEMEARISSSCSSDLGGGM